MGLKTHVSVAKSGTDSLRTTIPGGVVSYLELSSGDRLDWKMEILAGGKVVFVTKNGGGNNVGKKS